MTLTLLNVIYVLLAIAMIGFILVQRGAGAQAGSGFGSGASATVFGARGAGNFLTKSTAILATSFFVLSLIMGMYVTRISAAKPGEDLGVMGGATPTVTEPAPATDVPSASSDVPAATPAAPAVSDVPAPTLAAPAGDAPAPVAAAPSEPAPSAAAPATDATKEAPKQ
jgi:preprotein translocase subunit SecG